MKEKFLHEVEKFIAENHLLSQGDRVVAGVSGGADSVSLLLVLCKLKEKYDLKLFVVHVNHGLREEANEEAEYVKTLCKERDLPFYYVKEDVSALSKKLSMGVEEAGRKLRYDSFEKVLTEIGGGKIAVAHNKNDLTETMLFNLFRGTGIKGLSSIPPVRGNIIRPLLCVERAEIEEFLKEEGIRFCVDASNMSSEYSRNRLRNTVLPVIKENVTTNAVDHMAETASQLRELNFFLEKYCDEAFEAILLKEESDDRNIILSKEVFAGYDEYIRKMLVKKAIDRLVPNNKDITHTHLSEAEALAGASGMKSIDLPYGIKAVASYDTLTFTLDEVKKEDLSEVELVIGKDFSLSGNITVRAELEEYYEGYDYGQNKYTKCLDYDKIVRCPVFRKRQTGDELVINEKGEKKKLKNYMIDEKIPRDERDSLYVLASGNEVLWVLGYRISESVKITDKTKTVLKITVTGED